MLVHPGQKDGHVRSARPAGHRVGTGRTHDRGTLPADERIEAVRLLKPKLALPSHYGTWPPIEQDAAAWARRVEAAGLAAARAPAAGEPITVG